MPKYSNREIRQQLVDTNSERMKFRDSATEFRNKYNSVAIDNGYARGIKFGEYIKDFQFIKSVQK